MSFVEVWLEAVRAIDELCDAFGAIKRGFVIQHLLSATPIVAVWLVASGSGYPVHLPGIISNLDGARVAHGARLVAVWLPHEKLVPHVRNRIVCR